MEKLSNEVTAALFDGLKASAIYGGYPALRERLAEVVKTIKDAKTPDAGVAEAAAFIAPKAIPAADLKNLKDLIVNSNDVGGAATLAAALEDALIVLEAKA